MERLDNLDYKREKSHLSLLEETKDVYTSIEEEKAMWPRRQSDADTSQRMPAVTRNWKGQRTESPTPEGVCSFQHLDLSPVIPVLNFWLPKLWENKFLLFKATKFLQQPEETKIGRKNCRQSFFKINMEST